MLLYFTKLANEHDNVNIYLLKLAVSVVYTFCDVVCLFVFALIILIEQDTMKMILFRKFRVLILMVFLIACSMHIMIDLLPKLERRSNGACSCPHRPSEEPQNWGKHRPRSGPDSGWPNKHTLRILQDFSNEPSSNLSSHSLEKITAAGDKTEALKRLEHFAQNSEGKKQFIGDAKRSKNLPVKGSRLATLYEHPLYKRPLPTLTDEDTLFNVNTDIRFDPKAAENQEWYLSLFSELFCSLVEENVP